MVACMDAVARSGQQKATVMIGLLKGGRIWVESHLMATQRREKTSAQEQLDEILNYVKAPLLQVAAEHHLKNAKVERWRWDEPVINLIWSQEDQVGRKIEVRAECVSEHADHRDYDGKIKTNTNDLPQQWA